MTNLSSNKLSTESISLCDSVKTDQILVVKVIQHQHLVKLLGKYQLTLQIINQTSDIPGSYWGDSEAGLIANVVYARQDTPIHSLLHETCHYICMDQYRRKQLDTNAEGDYDEENAVCYLQILLANNLPGMSSQRMMQDMDQWGYTFRLGSAHSWFKNDADDAKQWLLKHQLIDEKSRPTYALRHT